nr:MAG TPA: hypothetical protein [Caudoviricetes sp.]
MHQIGFSSARWRSNIFAPYSMLSINVKGRLSASVVFK